ncbi:MAG: NADH dehydrogenase (ubiquinone), J subunit [uncultured bacterium]|nr:MAG: NADH dehydrogenase (ubiquinone), J subunit [uncultured bacterium]OGT34574.1 MAG: NADH:ubiquinone oxidoreductase subunit J [Gammaproteobacteria bacterium RIFCSPHIGHO2_02_FULL_39_13]OGT49994.1 MAG: NADH:ubiquinone oxidoreductase subunit J [Gammaproteobacteria bacterium RIFCSPHIGHO2_12_FULL_39_24]
MLFPIHEIIFYTFTVVLIASATAVITSKNSMRAVLFLVVAFFASAVLWMLMQAEFLSLVLIFVYVGAVMTLFLFVVMMIRIDQAEIKSRFLHYYLAGMVALIILAGTAFYVFSEKNWAQSNTLPVHYGANYNNTAVMGKLLFTHYLFPFEVTAVLLLVGMISAIALAFHGKKAGTKSQIISEQLAATKKERLRIVDLK